VDIFPRATDPGSMETRRKVLITAVWMAGVGLTTPLAEAVSPYIRLRDEHGDLRDEVARIRRELDAIAENEGVIPAPRTAVAVYATWANLDALHQPTNAEVAGLKARTAHLAAVNATTQMDRTNGPRWLDLAHRYGRMAGDDELVSLAHYQEALAGSWWGAPPQEVGSAIYLAGAHAATQERQGLVHSVRASVAAQRGDRRTAVECVERAVNLATPVQRFPRADRWILPQAHAFAVRTLCTFPALRAAVEAHAHEALNQLPTQAHRLRAHTRLNLAEAAARARELDGAAAAIMSTAEKLPEDQMAGTLRTRIQDIADAVEHKHPGNEPFRPVRRYLASSSV
jgi:hypothetical protein